MQRMLLAASVGAQTVGSQANLGKYICRRNLLRKPEREVGRNVDFLVKCDKGKVLIDAAKIERVVIDTAIKAKMTVSLRPKPYRGCSLTEMY